MTVLQRIAQTLSFSTITFGVMTSALLVADFNSVATAGTSFEVTSTADNGPGSLRQAIADANGSPGADLIWFNMPSGECSAAGVCSIVLGSGIDITDAVTIDGTTQPQYGTAPPNTCATDAADSYMRVEVSGPSGLRLLSVNSVDPSTIRGLAMGEGYSIALKSAGAHKVQCNHFGITGDGNAALGTWDYGILIESSAADAIVGIDGDGIDDLSERNVFGNCSTAIYNNGNPRIRIAGNYFGFLADGVTTMGNSTSLFIRQGSKYVLVGTDEDGISDDLEANIIGNSNRGIWAFTSATNGYAVRIVGNWIGLDAAGSPAGNNRGLDVSDSGRDYVLRGNRIENNVIGIEVDDVVSFHPTSMCNSIAGNTEGLIHGGAETDLAFKNNWWGTVDGPSGVGPGTGDSISVTGAGSVAFTPWMTSAADPCPHVFADGLEIGSSILWSDTVN